MSRYLLIRSLALAMMCLGISSSAWGQSAKLRIGDSYSCTFVPGLHILPVNLVAAGPVATARFKVEASSSVNFISHPNGEFDMPLPCVQNGSVGTFVVFVPAGPAVTFTIVPATGDSEIELTDCDGYAFQTVQECDLARLIAPYRPTPADGATDVPTNQLLSYVGEANHVVIGTDPELENPTAICNAGESLCALPLNPGLLAPNTTYYWQAVNYCVCGQVYQGNSEVFSFTTGDGPVATEASSWGSVKAMYRK